MGKKGKKKVNVDSNVKGDQIPEESKKLVAEMKEIMIDCSEQELYQTLSEYNLDVNDALYHLLSLGTFQEVKSKRNKKKEKRDKQVTLNHLAGASSASGICGPQDSDLANAETNREPLSTVDRVPSLPVPSSSNLTSVETNRVQASSVPSRSISPWSCGASYADVVTGLGSWKENVTGAPVEDDTKPEQVPYLLSNCLTESLSTRRDQLEESNQNLPKEDVTTPFSYSFPEFLARGHQLGSFASTSNENLPENDYSFFSNLSFQSIGKKDKQLPVINDEQDGLPTESDSDKEDQEPL